MSFGKHTETQETTFKRFQIYPFVISQTKFITPYSNEHGKSIAAFICKDRTKMFSRKLSGIN